MEATRSLFDRPQVPDAIFVGNDHMAFAVLDVLRVEMGLRVPDDVSVVGYDDVSLACWPSFDLTTVRQPANRMVEAAVAQMMALIARRELDETQIEIDGPLILRGSAKIPKGWTT